MPGGPPGPSEEAQSPVPDPHRRVLLMARLVSVIAVAMVSLRFAWLSDDALITVRTVLNALHGYGPVFNVDERVMGYTHPLWMALLTVAGAVTGDVILAPMLLGTVLTVVAWAVIVASVTSVSRLAVGTVAILLCNSIVEYSAAGLENPLAFVFLAGLIVLGRQAGRLRRPDDDPAEDTGRATILRALALGLLAAGTLLTRLDLILVIAPALALVAWQMRRRPRFLVPFAVAWATPLALWAVIALAFYGEILPSTFPAKTNLAIPRSELLFSGVNYLLVSFAFDPVALIILVTALAWGIFAADACCRSWLLGAGLYLVYVVWVGGDFMAGRFLAVPVFVALAAMLTVPRDSYVALVPDQPPRSVARTASLVGCALLVLVGLGRADVLDPDLPNGPRWELTSAGGVADERGFYLVKGRSLAQFLGSPLTRSGEFIDPEAFPEGWQPDIAQLRATAASWRDGAGTEDVAIKCGGLGEAGISTGPAVHWIDPCGLTDRFLAAIPYRAEGFAWRIGHFDRPLPPGYLEAVEAVNPQLVEDPALRWELERLWERIRP